MSNTVIVNDKGMITIPKKIREQVHITKGTQCEVLLINGTINVIPILSDEEFEESLTASYEEFQKSMEKSRNIDLELER